MDSLTANLMRRATLGDQLRRHAQQRPSHPAVVFYHPSEGRKVITYAELDRRANAIANGLAELGIVKGDAVAMMSRNSPDYAAIVYACLRLGAPFTGINFTFKSAEIRYQLEHAEAKVVVVEGAFVDSAEQVCHDLTEVKQWVVSNASDDEIPSGWITVSDLESDPIEPLVELDDTDVAFLQYTSGTEAFPKAVMISHQNYLIATLPAWQATIGVKPDDTWLFLMPFHTLAGLGTLTILTQLGATLVLVHSVDPPSALRMMEDEGVTIMAQTPTFFIQMSQAKGFDEAVLDRLERCITYGGTMAGSTLSAWSKRVPGLLWGTYYGQSELSQLGSTGWFRHLSEVPEEDPTWIGKPMPQIETRVVDLDDNDAEIGELICRSPTIMLGYFKDPERTEQVFRGGWLRTGDIVRVDSDGNLFFYDRIKDTIKTGGMNVSSQEVERVLFEHPAVLECGVVGMPDDYWSETVTAHVVLRSGASAVAEDIIQYCKDRMAGYKVPKVVRIVDSLPRDTQGKLLKRKLRESNES